MRRIKSIEDVVAYRLCVGCGACAQALDPGVAAMVDVPESGLRPSFSRPLSDEENRRAQEVCPGLQVCRDRRDMEIDPVVGPARQVWVGYASDAETRQKGSSGGALNALAQYCLEKYGADYVAHTGMDPEAPWKNKSVTSTTRNGLLQNAGSRYAPSSPCDHFRAIRNRSTKTVFVGKPCDIAAFSLTAKTDRNLADRVVATLAFFCAGTPTSQSVYDLAYRAIGKQMDEVTELRFRGEGWPGEFEVRAAEGWERTLYSYQESWAELQSHRGLRCQLCADGMGELADISCGDAWHRYTGDKNPGLSIVVARSETGLSIVNGAMEAGYIVLNEVDSSEVIDSQGSEFGIANRKQQVWGRLLGLRVAGVPTPVYRGFSLFSAWSRLSLLQRTRSVAGTVFRALKRGWRNPVRHQRPDPATREDRQERPEA